MNKNKPYTYYIRRKKDGLQYYGVRYANIVSPENDLGKIYFSSGEFQKEFKKQPKNFEYKVHKIFESKKDAIKYELKITKRIFKRTNWVNQASYPAILMTDEIKNKISKTIIENGMRKGKNNSMYGKSNYYFWMKKYGKAEADRRQKIVNEKNKKANSGEKSAMYGRSSYDIWVEKYGKEEADRRQYITNNKKSKSKSGKNNYWFGKSLSENHKNNISKNHADISGKNNPMYGRSVYSLWLEKYGKKEADRRQKISNEKNSESNKNKHQKSNYYYWEKKYGYGKVK